MRAAAAVTFASTLAIAALAATALAPKPPAPGLGPTAQPERIVALSLSAAEMLVELVPPERIAAVHTYVAESSVSNVRGRLLDHPRVGSDAEAILAVAPDLVVAAPYVERSFVEPLARSGIALHEVGLAADFAAIFEEMRRLGHRVGEPGRAEAAIARTRARIAAATHQVPPSGPAPRVLFLVGEDRVAGRNTTYDTLARLAGARNVAAAHGVEGLGYRSAEVLARWKADVVVVARAPERGPPLAAAVRRDPRYGALGRARVVTIDEAHLTATSSHLVRGLRDLVEELYP